MMKVKLVLFIFILACPVYSQNFYQKDISVIEYLLLEQGSGLPFKSFPYSYDEYYSYVDRIDAGKLSASGKLFLNSNLKYLNKEYLYSETDGFEFNVGVEPVLEGFYHWNLDNNFDFPVSDYTWQYGYEERQPMLNIPLEARILDVLYVKTNITAKEEHFTVNSPGLDTASENYFNILDFNNPHLDIHFPFQAVASLGKEHWNVQLGRDQLSWGNGQTGNLVLSDFSDFYDFLLVNTYWKNFKFSSVYIVMDEYSPRDENVNIEYFSFIGHRFDLRFFNRLNIALNEVVTYSDDPFLIKDLNSVMIYHNWTIPTKTNSIISLEFEYLPWKYFYFYGQLAMDEFATKYEKEGDGGGGDPTWGWLAGVKGAYPFGPGYILGNIEFVLTDPLLYNRNESPYFYNVRKIWSLVTDSYEYIVKPIGHEAGPDALLWYFNLGYDWFPYLKSQLDFSFLTQGETTIASAYEDSAGLKTPSGTAEYVSVIHLGMESRVFSFLTAGLDLYYINVLNYGHVKGQRTDDMEIAGYIKFSF